jgi:hypothetical protein
MSKDKEPRRKLDYSAWIARLKEAGFETTARDANRVLVSKYGCGALLEKTQSGEPRFAVRPGLLATDEIAHLMDRGYQKFWQAGDRSFPALAEQLKALHQFDQDLRALTGGTSLYNEALGTVSSLYVYDRVEGREEPKSHLPFD